MKPVIVLGIANGVVECISNPTDVDIILHDFDIQNTDNPNFEYGNDGDDDFMIVRFPSEGVSLVEPQHDREPDWVCPRCGHRNAADNEVCMGAEMGDGQCRKSKPDKVKPLAQYLDEYIEREIELGNIDEFATAGHAIFLGQSWAWLLEQAFDAYESTENVTIKIERV